MTPLVIAPDDWDPVVREALERAVPPALTLAFGPERLEQAEFLVAATRPVTAGTFASARRLRLVHKWGVGLDTIDLDGAAEAGVGVAVTTGANAHAVAEHTLMLMLAALRQLPYANATLRDGRWVFPEMRARARQLSGRTVGIVGLGHIGRAVAQRLRGFDVELLYTDPVAAPADIEKGLGVTRVECDELLRRADVLTLHCPGGAENRHLIGAAELARLPADAVVVNTARGEVLDRSALLDALEAGHLLGAGLDVHDPEPPPPGDPLLLRDDVIATPHSAGSVLDNVPRVAAHVFANVERVLRGEPIPDDDLVVPVRRAQT